MTTAPETRATVLCVDDEPQVLDGLGLHLRRRYQFVPAVGARAALEILATTIPTVIISDMRMPGMDGAALLAKARTLCPDSVRMLLTGHAEVEAAAAAVNDGQVFRFLTKPCPPATLLAAVEAAVRQHQLIHAERVLLEQTLWGAVKALTEVLALTNPAAFGRAARVRQLVSALAPALTVRDVWQVEVAAMMCQLGSVTLPPETAEKVYFSKLLTDAELQMVQKAPEFVEQVLGNIPRLETVRLLLQTSRDSAAVPSELANRPELLLAVQLLRASMDLEKLDAQGLSRVEGHSVLLGRKERYGTAVMRELAVLSGATAEVAALEIPVSGLRAGMVLLDDVHMSTGQLLATRGFEVTGAVLQRVRNFPPGAIREPIKVRPPPAA